MSKHELYIVRQIRESCAVNARDDTSPMHLPDALTAEIIILPISFEIEKETSYDTIRKSAENEARSLNGRLVHLHRCCQSMGTSLIYYVGRLERESGQHRAHDAME